MLFRSLQNASSGTQELKGLKVEELGTEAWTVRFDLEVHAIERNGQLDIVWIYNRDLFDRWRVEQMARHYEALLTAAMQDLKKPVRHLAMLSASEIDQLKIGKTPQGKKVGRTARNPYVAPETPLQQMVASVWQQALGLERVGLDDNFFELGAYSLLVARVRFTLRERLQKEIALVDFFFCPTVRLLAAKLEHNEESLTMEKISRKGF